MKKRLFILLLIPIQLFGTDYYVSNTGDDGANGTSTGTPWQTITKVNSVWAAGTFADGDRILFNKGDTFVGEIVIAESSGASDITISSYGSGALPIITSFTTVSGWTNEGGGIYSKVISSESNRVNVLTIDGVMYAMGRYPDATYLTYESFNTSVSITDNTLGESTDWAGAEAAIRLNEWSLDRCLITDHTSNTLTYTNLGTGQTGTNGFGYFIQNDLRTLTAYGEWYYSGTELFVYFGAVDPTTKVIKIATLDNLLSGAAYDNITIDGIKFSGCNADIVYFTGYYIDGIVIQNCTFEFAGRDGIHYEPNNRNCTINNNIFDNNNGAGIYLQTGNDNTITNNTITNTGLLLGIAYSGTYTDGIYFKTQTTGLIQYNTIIDAGYNGIYFTGSYTEVRNNYIVRALTNLNDGGGIYTSGASNIDRVIDGNVILNSIGGKGGGSVWNMAEGIYLDELGADIAVSNNTIANCGANGIKVHKGHDNVFTYNTSYNNNDAIYFLNSTTTPYIEGNSLTHNIFFVKKSTDRVFSIQTNANDILTFGTADYNIYTRPIDETVNTFYNYQQNTGAIYRTLAQWKTYSSQDANSTASLGTAIADTANINFIYNGTTIAKSFTLSQAMDDVYNTAYSGTIVLQPYTSLILLGAGTITEEGTPEPPIAATVTTTQPVFIPTTSASSGGEVTSDGGGTVSARGVCWSTSVNPTTADSKTTDGTGEGVFTSSITGLSTGLIYHVRAYATNEIGTSYGNDMTFSTVELTNFKKVGSKFAKVGTKFAR